MTDRQTDMIGGNYCQDTTTVQPIFEQRSHRKGKVVIPPSPITQRLVSPWEAGRRGKESTLPVKQQVN